MPETHTKKRIPVCLPKVSNNFLTMAQKAHSSVVIFHTVQLPFFTVQFSFFAVQLYFSRRLVVFFCTRGRLELKIYRHKECWDTLQHPAILKLVLFVLGCFAFQDGCYNKTNCSRGNQMSGLEQQ